MSKTKKFVGGGTVGGKPKQKAPSMAAQMTSGPKGTTVKEPGTGYEYTNDAVPDFAKDKNQDTKNQDAAESYKANRKFASGGSVKASRGDGCAQRGKTRGSLK